MSLLRPQFENTPPDWQLIPLKRLMRVDSGKEVPLEVPPSETAVPVYGSGADPFKYTVESISNQQSILFGRKGTLGQPYIVEPPFWAVDTAYIGTPHNGMDIRYLNYLLQVFDWQPFITNTAKPSLVAKDILPEKVPVPSECERNRILHFLARKSAEIDGLVGKLQREAELLQQYRRELIAYTVTRGLDPNVPMKDSGVEWIGEGPATWTSVSAKTIFIRRAEFERSGDVHLTPSQMFGVLPQEDFIAVSGIKPTLKLSDSGKMKHVEPGDFIIHLRSFQGGLEYSKYPGKVSPAYTVITPRNDQLIDRSFFRWLFKSTAFITYLASMTKQLRDGQSINFKTFSKTCYLLPSLVEQREIAAFLDQKTEEIDSTISGINKQIELLGMYRKQVINDAITGKVRVGEVA